MLGYKHHLSLIPGSQGMSGWQGVVVAGHGHCWEIIHFAGLHWHICAVKEWVQTGGVQT